MARIVIASEAGACYGVERALQMVEHAADEATGPVHTLGPLIHNPRVVSDLAARGVTVVSGPEEAAGGTLLLRTHGVTPDEETRARSLCSEVLDATCPFVKKVHLAARRLADEGYQVVVVGEKGHPEVEATLPHAPGAIVVGTAEEAEAPGPLQEARRCRPDHAVPCPPCRRGVGPAVQGRGGPRDEHHLRGHERATRAPVPSLPPRQTSWWSSAGASRPTPPAWRRSPAGSARPRTTSRARTSFSPSGSREPDVIGITAGASTPASQIEAVRGAIQEMLGA